MSIRTIPFAGALGLGVLAMMTSPAAAEDPAPEAVECMAEAVYFEARGTTDKGALAVAHVVKNCREDADFPDTICEVVTEECQFSYQCDGEPETLANSAERKRAYDTAEAVLSGETDDPTDGALFFHADEADPGWFATRPRVGEIAGNVFYR